MEWFQELLDSFSGNAMRLVLLPPDPNTIKGIDVVFPNLEQARRPVPEGIVAAARRRMGWRRFRP
jgi:hypothetical protein